MWYKKLALPLLLAFLLSCNPSYNGIKRTEGIAYIEYCKRSKHGAYIIDKHYYDSKKDGTLDLYEEFVISGDKLSVRKGEKDFEIHEKEFENVVKEYEEQEKKK